MDKVTSPPASQAKALRANPNRQRKEKIVAGLVEKINRSKGFIFANYQGLTHKQLEGLKKKVQSFDADFVVTKNSLILKAMEARPPATSSTQSQINQAGVAGEAKYRTVPGEVGRGKIKMENELKNATATLFIYADPTMPLKALVKSTKELSLPTIKFGILEGAFMTNEQLLKLSALPSRQDLLTQLVFGLKSPISGFHRSLLWNMQNFVLTLKFIENSKK